MDAIELEIAAELAALRENSSTWMLFAGLMAFIGACILALAVGLVRHHRAPVHIDAELYQIWKWRAAARGMTVEQWLEDMTGMHRQPSRTEAE